MGSGDIHCRHKFILFGLVRYKEVVGVQSGIEEDICLLDFIWKLRQASVIVMWKEKSLERMRAEQGKGDRKSRGKMSVVLGNRP